MYEEKHATGRVNRKALLLLFLLIVGVGIIYLLQTRDAPFILTGPRRLEKSVSAPDFTFPDLDGKIVSLADFRGKVVLLNIWATWCAPCVEEMPSMEKLYRTLKDKGLEILAVSIDETGADAVRPFMIRHRLSFPALTDTSGTIKNLYQTTGVPESFIIDKEGIIAEKVIGARNWASPAVIRFIRDLIQGN